jgi:hypothetical protein
MNDFIGICEKKWGIKIREAEHYPIMIYDFLVNKVNYHHILFNNFMKHLLNGQEQMDGKKI